MNVERNEARVKIKNGLRKFKKSSNVVSIKMAYSHKQQTRNTERRDILQDQCSHKMN